MPRSVATSPRASHPVLPDIGKARMAKADVRVPDIAWNERIGGAIQRAVALVGWSNKEAAAVVGVDDAEFGKWLSGGRRPQLDRLMAIQALRWPLIQSLASLDEQNEVVTTIRRRVVAVEEQSPRSVNEARRRTESERLQVYEETGAWVDEDGHLAPQAEDGPIRTLSSGRVR